MKYESKTIKYYYKLHPTKNHIIFNYHKIFYINATDRFVIVSNFPWNSQIFRQNNKKGVESDFRRKCWRNVTSPPRRDYIHHVGLSFRISGKEDRRSMAKSGESRLRMKNCHEAPLDQRGNQTTTPTTSLYHCNPARICRNDETSRDLRKRQSTTDSRQIDRHNCKYLDSGAITL